MKVLINFLMLVTVVLFATLCTARLDLYTAGRKSIFVGELRNGMQVCPKDYPKGFTIVCEGSKEDNFAKMMVNGKQVRVERSKPYYIAGDGNGAPHPWTTYPTNARIQCLLLPTRARYSVSLTFACDRDLQVPDNGDIQPGALFFVPSGVESNDRVRITSGMSFCPQDAFGTMEFTIQCQNSPKAKRARFLINGKKVKVDYRRPFFISGKDDDGLSKPMRWERQPTSPFKVACDLDDGWKKVVRDVQISCPPSDDSEPASTPQDEMGSGNESGQDSGSGDGHGSVTGHDHDKDQELDPERDLENGQGIESDTEQDEGQETEDENISPCIILSAFETELSAGWVGVETGLSYKPNNISAKLAKPGEAPLSYTFQPLHQSRYAIVVDMTSGATSKFNDLFLSFEPSGFQVMRRGNSKIVTGWIRAYHNKNGRAAFSSYLDGDAYSLSTADVLEMGQTYEIMGNASAGIGVISKMPASRIPYNFLCPMASSPLYCTYSEAKEVRSEGLDVYILKVAKCACTPS